MSSVHSLSALYPPLCLLLSVPSSVSILAHKSKRVLVSHLGFQQNITRKITRLSSMTMRPVSERCPSRTMLRRASATSFLSSFPKQAQQSNRAVSSQVSPGGENPRFHYWKLSVPNDADLLLAFTDPVGAVESVKAASDIVRTPARQPPS